MDFHLEHKVRFTQDTSYKSLYPWCLQEVNSEGKGISADLIPWKWGLVFTASEMRLEKRVHCGGIFSENEEDLTFETTEVIYAPLYSGICRDGEELEDDVRLSMLGTSRSIDKISLFITPVTDVAQEQCQVWGGVSYTSEIEFVSETTPDSLEVHLTLTRARFDLLAKNIENKSVDIATLKIADVSGVYSQWSPIAETREVKILTSDSEHQVLLPDNCDVDVPRLCTVGEFSLSLTNRCPLKPKQNLKPLDVTSEFKDSLLDEDEDEEVTLELKTDNTELFLYKISNAQAELTKLRMPLWLIVILLTLMLISNHW
ncbi:hypothetical protein BBM60_00250 [Vibrio parahaemolyticus]|uniref:hypothetical protein n=3 Tax=Vibrio parahaemolyticus TaxID=670 RepID=UPI00084AB92E|nr:hypothetical protein [Vibrio parahaemolyticus]EJI6687093.1 hypothetical protein [Vibrio parahaemolyticus]OEA46468.1 hypothetical protein BBM60_00250 [Vibrio parahaemolyticus]OEA89829.1 hypothetical protein BBM71_15970 [Vibrio parahaemolyticus]OEA94751.1 hypothetical protein BBN03_00015 [Vibrio parahaemolyticus]